MANGVPSTLRTAVTTARQPRTVSSVVKVGTSGGGGGVSVPTTGQTWPRS